MIRLDFLAKSVQEEQAKQVIRYLVEDDESQYPCEFQGNIEIDRYLLCLDETVCRDSLLRDLPEQLEPFLL
jgi:hypothetical protein